jgi:GxxExxY protein
MEKTTVKKDLLYPELSYRVMQAVFEVHNHLGPGFTEDIYETALALELELQGIPFERQKQIQVQYKDHYVGTYRLDLVIDGKIILELKAVSEHSSFRTSAPPAYSSVSCSISAAKGFNQLACPI